MVCFRCVRALVCSSVRLVCVHHTFRERLLSVQEVKAKLNQFEVSCRTQCQSVRNSYSDYF